MSDIMLIGLGHNGATALIETADYELIEPHKWRLSGKGYAITHKRNGTPHSTLMHRVILAAPPGTFVDHINRNRLDNRRSNLRLATLRQNAANRKPLSASGLKGVVYNRGHRRWQAYIKPGGGQQQHLGYYATPIEAAHAYNAAARDAFGDFANTNDDTPPSRDW